MRLRAKCLNAMYAEAQYAHETEISTPCYRTLMADVDGSVYWRESASLHECGVAEYYGCKRDYWSLQQFGNPGVEFNGLDWEVYEIQLADAETLLLIEVEIADWGDIARDDWKYDADGGATGEPGGWYQCTDEFRDVQDLDADVDDLFWQAIEMLDEIPMGFFTDEEKSEEWEAMAA